MKAKIILLGVVLIALAAVLVTIRLDRTAEQTRRALADVTDKHVLVQAEQNQAAARAQAIGQRKAALEAELAGLGSPAKAAGAETKPAAAGARTMRDVLLNDPKLQAEWLAAWKVRLAQDFAPFYAALRLTPHEIERVQAALIRRQETGLDLAAVAQEKGPEAKEAIATLRKQADEEFAQTLRELRGESACDQFQEYERNSPIRAVVRMLGGTSAVEGEPLQPEQAQQLTQVIAAAVTRKQGVYPDLKTVRWEQVDEQARKILTPAQYAWYESGPRLELELDAAIAKAKQADLAARPAK